MPLRFLLSGPDVTDLTWIVDAFVNDFSSKERASGDVFGTPVLRIDGSLHRGIDVIRNRIVPFVQTEAMDKGLPQTDRNRCCRLDDPRRSTISLFHH